MTSHFYALLFLTALACAVLPERARGQEYPKLAPYQAIQWKENVPEVQLDGEWFVLKSINDIPVTEIVAFAKEKYRSRRQKRFDEDLVQVLSEMGGTDGLVVDVRDNGGGSRDALRVLYSYLVGPKDPPRVVTTAVFRTHKIHEEDHLTNRFMYRADADVWTKRERIAIAAFARTFKPEWKPPKSQFSDRHYMVLGRLVDPGIFHYKKPVVLLMNAKCFSATDIFLSGLKGLKNVTLLGTPSGGGSARSESIPLGETPFRLRIGTMVSFQADGRLFDGNGVRPDVVIEPLPGHFIGGPDNVLAEAVKRIKGE